MSPLMRFHDDLTVSKALLASSFMRSHDDLKVFKAVLASPFMRYLDDLTAPRLSLRVLKCVLMTTSHSIRLLF